MRAYRFPAAALALSLLAVVLARVVASDGEHRATSEPATITTTSPGPAPLPGPQGPGTTTTVKGAPVQSGGAAPVAGAVLSIVVDPTSLDDGGEPVDVGEETDCAALDPALEPVACTRAEGSGGGFLVYAGRRRDDDALQSRLYRAARPGGDEFVLVRRSQFFKPGSDVVGMALHEAETGDEPVVVVDYDFDGSGSVHSFDVVAWDSSDVDPRVVAFVNGTGGDRVVRSRTEAEEEAGGGLRFVGANYDDGAPTCCPNNADVRTLEHPGPGRWAITKETVPFARAP